MDQPYDHRAELIRADSTHFNMLKCSKRIALFIALHLMGVATDKATVQHRLNRLVKISNESGNQLLYFLHYLRSTYAACEDDNNTDTANVILLANVTPYDFDLTMNVSLILFIAQKNIDSIFKDTPTNGKIST
jgi:hypothetical protein